ncbi:hypothetical protein [Enterobacter mori]
MTITDDIQISGGFAVSVENYKYNSVTNGITKAAITVFEAPAGYGKTATMSRQINAMSPAECVLVVLPKLSLMEQYKVHNPDWTYVFTGSASGGSVAEAALDAILARTRRLVITQATAEVIARRIGVDTVFTDALSDYNVYFDEVVNSKHSVALAVEKGKEHAHDWLRYIGQSGSEPNIFEAYRPDMIQDILNNGTGNPQFKAMMFHLSSGQQVQKIEFEDKTLYASTGDKATFRFLGACKSFMMAGAAVEKLSFVTRAKELFGHGLTITKFTEKTVAYPRPERCTIIPVSSGAASYRRDAEKFEEYCRAALDNLPSNKPFLYAVNKDKDVCDFQTIADRIFIPAGGVKLPYSAHGLNDFAGYKVHKGVLSVATRSLEEAERSRKLNPNDQSKWKVYLTEEQYQDGFDNCVFFGMARVRPTDKRWMSDEEVLAVELERGAETCFQALTRTTLRNMSDSVTPHTFIVIDQVAADHASSIWLAGADVRDPVFNTQTKQLTKRNEKNSTFVDAVRQLVAAGKKVTAPNVLKLVNGHLDKNQCRRLVSAYNKRELEVEGLIYG